MNDASPMNQTTPASALSMLPSSLSRVPVTVQVLLGSTRVPLSEMLAMAVGSTIVLDQKLGAPVKLMVNGCEIASGELYVLDGEGERLGLKITSMAAGDAQSQPTRT